MGPHHHRRNPRPLQELLDHLADGDWDTALGTPVDEKAVTAATQPLTDAGWNHTADGRWIRWTTPAGDAGVWFDAFAAQHHPEQALATWTIWGGTNPDRSTWTLHASPHTPSSLLADLSENLAHGTGTRQAQSIGHDRRANLATSPLTIPAPKTGPSVSRTR